MTTEQAASRFDFKAIDADGHYYEPHDAYTRHIESKFKDRCITVVKDDKGLGRLYFAGKKMGMMRVSQTDYTGMPGSRVEFFQGLQDDGKGWQQTEVINAHDFPEMMEKSARLRLMDRQGIEASLLFPSVGVAVEHEMHDDCDALYANLRAFNRWLEEDWGYGDDGRIFAAPMISLVDVDQAVAETERVLKAGAKVLHLKKGPLYGDSPANPNRDRFWALAAEANVPVAFHTGDAGYYETWGTQWGEQARPPLQYTSPFNVYLNEASTGDTFANLILNNLFQRFPTLKILSIENGSSWLGGVIKGMKKAAAMTRGQAGLGGPFLDDPHEIIRRNFWFCPYFEEDPVELAELIGTDHVLFGSDWPHPEGLAEPLDFANKLEGRVDEVSLRKVMRGNIARLVGLAA